MEDLLPYYERELAFMRRHSGEFAERYPKIAGQLALHGDGCDDPHVERMIQSFALLNARTAKKLEDSYPQFTEALLSVLYPHYLRPFPSCSIAQFDTGSAASGLTKPTTTPRGTEVKSRPVNGVACRFRTAWDLRLVPARVSRVWFSPLPDAGDKARLPADCSALLHLTLAKGSEQVKWRDILDAPLRIFIDAEPSTAAALRDTLFQNVAGIYAVSGDGAWQELSAAGVGEVGFADDEALIDFPDNAHDGYRHLTEYFAFAEKYNFVDLSVAEAAPRWADATEISIHIALREVRADSDTSRLLQTLTRDHLRTGCVPVVNLFEQRADPIRITGRTTAYPVVPDARKAAGYEVYSIDAVKRVRQTAEGESITEFRPFFSLRHGETPAEDGHYWYSTRDPELAKSSPGYETQLMLVDANFDAVTPKTDVLSLSLTCTNRDLPHHLATGLSGGDLTLEGGSVVGEIRLLRRPTKPYRFDYRGDGQWRLISQLSLNHLSITGGGVKILRELLALYDLPRNAVSRRRVDGVVDVSQKDKTAWLPGKPFASFVRGLEVTITVDEDSFVGTGLDAFARIMDRFLGLYVNLNSFVELVLRSARTGEELIRCAPRSGESILA